MKTTITTTDGRNVDLTEGTYYADGGFGKIVHTIIVRENGKIFCGPSVTRETWSEINHLQTLMQIAGK